MLDRSDLEKFSSEVETRFTRMVLRVETDARVPGSEACTDMTIRLYFEFDATELAVVIIELGAVHVYLQANHHWRLRRH